MFLRSFWHHAAQLVHDHNSPFRVKYILQLLVLLPFLTLILPVSSLLIFPSHLSGHSVIILSDFIGEIVH